LGFSGATSYNRQSALLTVHRKIKKQKGTYMKKMNLVLSTLSLLTLATPAFAHVLPADATNVTVSNVTIGYDVTSQTLISDGNDGPVYQNNYSPVLDVQVTYTSKDQSDDATALDNSGDEEVVVGGPTLDFYLPVTAAQVAAIKAKTLDPKTLVAISITPAPVQFNNPVFTSSCIFNNDSSQPENPECIQNVYSTEMRPVLSVNLK
jgi:hypothetical protein